MDWENKETMEGSDSGAAAQGAKHGPTCTCGSCRSGKRGKHAMLSVLAFVLIVAGVLWVLAYLGLDYRPLAATGAADDWKAVFLNNGQVYFGKVQNEQADPLVLTDIYYLQVQQQLQPAQGQQQQTQQSLSLIKFGNELHGPQDEMRVVRRNVLYIESLKEDGRVVDAINRYLAEQQGNQ